MVGRALAPCAALALLACGAPAPGRPAAPVEEADAAPAPAFVIYEGDAISPLARDDGFLYWAAPDGVLRRPLGGPDAGEIAVVSRATAGLTITALVVAGDRVVCTDGGQVVAVPVVGDPDAAPVVLGDGLEPVTALAGDAGGVYAALGDTIVELRAGAEPRQVAIGQGEVTSLALDADSVWWVDHDPDPDAGDPTAPLGARITGEGAVRRAPRAGGPIAEVAGAQPSPVQVRRHGDRVYWATERGVAVRSLPVAGHATPRVELDGRAGGLAVDDRGVVAIDLGGTIRERRADGTIAVLATGDGVLTPALDRDAVVADGWVYAVAVRNDLGRPVLTATPRGRDDVTVAAPVTGQLQQLRSRGGALYWVETDRDGAGRAAVYRADPRRHRRRLLGRFRGWVSDLAVGEGAVYLAADTEIFRVPTRGGKVGLFRYTAAGAVQALTVHRGHLLWVNGAALVALRLTARAPFEVARNDRGSGGGDLGATLVFDDDYVYLTSFGWGGTGVYRISERGQVTVLWDGATTGSYPTGDLVRLGDQLYFVADGALRRLDVTGGDPQTVATFGEDFPVAMVSGGDLLYLMVRRSGPAGEWLELDRVVPGEAPVAILRCSAYGSDLPRLADDDAAYLFVDDAVGIMRIARDAAPWPGLPLAPM